MQKIVRGKPYQLEAAKKCFRRILEEEALPLSEEDFSLAFLEERVLVLCENSRVYGFACTSRDLSSSLFPNQDHAFGKLEDLLEQINDQGEDQVVITCFGVDPICAYQEQGKQILNAVKANYHNPTLLALVDPSATKQIEFFKRFGFVVAKGYEEQGKLLLVRKEVKEGLARGLAW